MKMAASQVSARERARKAKAILDAARKEQDRQVVEATTAYFEAADAVEAAQRAVAVAEAERAAAVVKLGELDQSVVEVAALCGITETEVRALRKKNATSGSETEEAQPAAPAWAS